MWGGWTERRCVEAGEDVREGSRLRGGEERTCVMEERRSVLSATHLTPLSQKAVQRGSLHYVKWGEEQVVLGNTQSLSAMLVISSTAGLLESMVKCFGDSGVPRHVEKFHSIQ